MRKSNIKYLGLILILISVFIFGFAAGKEDKESVLSEKSTPRPSIGLASPEITSPNTEDPWLVTKVIDGDTIVVSIGENEETLRQIGIDTPETVDPRKGIQCFGIEASNKAKELLLGKSVYLESDSSQGERDKYQRLLRYVILPDGENFGLTMIREGYAHEYTYDLPYRYQPDFKAAEKNASENNLGLWNPEACRSSSETSQAPEEKYVPKGTYTCDCQKLCGQITACDEAYYQLENCGCSARDSDGDGVPCETLCR